jgi:hypothetical protein
MSTTLSILSNFEVDDVSGNTVTGKQGPATASFSTPFDVTVNGAIHYVPGILATATVQTVYDNDDDVPITFQFGFFWASVVMYLQVIAAGSNYIHKVLANVPFWIPGYDTMLAAANTTPITGGTEPTLTAIDSIVIGNYSGGSGNFLFAVIY